MVFFVLSEGLGTRKGTALGSPNVAVSYPLRQAALSWYGAVWSVAEDCSVYMGDLTDAPMWYIHSGNLLQVCISANARQVWGVNWIGEIYPMTNSDGHWLHERGPKLERICVSGNGRQAW